ncbi:hypothetical protein NPIL_56511 [Nephila pilipes]|uniref:Uncharacterized protein n=1 Tax=Nephila pilipes TaxID=299642 RepID=A0A8X6NXL9_NEPPI|nr:hypothetical protein NPIL_56511 [Nephila pilipes]
MPEPLASGSLPATENLGSNSSKTRPWNSCLDYGRWKMSLIRVISWLRCECDNVYSENQFLGYAIVET